MSTQPTRIPQREPLRSVREAPVNQQYAARFLNLHPKTVLRKAREGSFPAHPVGTGRKRWHFYLSELDHWLRSQVISAATRVAKPKEIALAKRYQYGSVEINKRVTGPDVWLYRWWEPTSDGRRTRRGFTVGTVEKYRTETRALKAAEGMRLMINDGILRREPVLFCGILDRFPLDQKQEEDAEQITHNTLASYRSMICQHIRPKWGDAYLEDVRPALVQDWLRKLVLSPKYKGHIRSLMYRLFDKAMLWESLNVERNPMDLVEVKGISKRKKRPCVLPVKGAWQMLDALVQPFRNIVLIALCFGLRISDILGLRWTDFDFKRSVVLVQRSAVGKRLNNQQIEDGIFAGRGSNRTGLYPRNSINGKRSVSIPKSTGFSRAR